MRLYPFNFLLIILTLTLAHTLVAEGTNCEEAKEALRQCEKDLNKADERVQDASRSSSTSTSSLLTSNETDTQLVAKLRGLRLEQQTTCVELENAVQQACAKGPKQESELDKLSRSLN